MACLPQAQPVLAKQGVVALLKVMFLASQSPTGLREHCVQHGPGPLLRKEILNLGLVKIMARLMNEPGAEADSILYALC